MQFERLFGLQIVPHLLAVFHLSLTCHQSGHLPPPLLNPGEDCPSLPLLFFTPHLLNPWETRQGD